MCRCYTVNLCTDGLIWSFSVVTVCWLIAKRLVAITCARLVRIFCSNSFRSAFIAVFCCCAESVFSCHLHEEHTVTISVCVIHNTGFIITFPCYSCNVCWYYNNNYYYVLIKVTLSQRTADAINTVKLDLSMFYIKANVCLSK